MIVQQYIIVMPDHTFSTNWFDAENHFVEGSTVINLATGMYTTDGENWNEVEEDHL